MIRSPRKGDVRRPSDDDASELFERRDAGRDFLEAVVPEGPHSLLAGLGCDLVEISPLHDVGQATSYLGAQLLFEMVSIVPPTRKP